MDGEGSNGQFNGVVTMPRYSNAALVCVVGVVGEVGEVGEVGVVGVVGEVGEVGVVGVVEVEAIPSVVAEEDDCWSEETLRSTRAMQGGSALFAVVVDNV